MKLKRKKFNILKFITFLLLVAALYLIISFALSVRVKNIIIKGNNYYSDEVIIETAEIENYPKFVFLSKSKIEKKLKKLDLINDVKIIKKYNFALEVEVEEKVILYLIRSTNEYKLSTNENIKLNGVIGTPTLINYVPEKVENKLVQKLSTIDIDVRNKISELQYSPASYDDERFLLYMTDENEVYITLSKIENLNKYIEIIKELEGKKGILYLDSGNYFEIKEK